MSNYYETLKITQSATSSEVQTAYENAYNYWRNLVNHHDPQMVQTANQALTAIEQIRTTLLDPVKRANYDATLSIGTIGGLADTSAQLASQPVMTPPNVRSSPLTSRMTQTINANSDSWLCSKCNSVNSIGTRFCKKCGNQLGTECPKCQTLLEATAQFCSVCGVNIRDFEREIEVKTAESEALRIAEQRRVEQLEAIIGPVKKHSNLASTMMGVGCLLSLCYGFPGIPFWIISFINAQKALSFSQVYGDEEYRKKAKTARIISGIALGLVGLALVVFAISFVYSLISNGFQGGY
jgi:ribosomal protein L40E